jgi:L-arabinose isomerase
MEDYTYDLEPGKELSLGAHMLEVCPSVAAEKPRIEVHPLGIGGKAAPARLVFEGHPGNAIVVSLIDMGGRLRMIVQDIECIKPISAGSSRYVEGYAGSENRYPRMDHGRRCASYGALLCRYR